VISRFPKKYKIIERLVRPIGVQYIDAHRIQAVVQTVVFIRKGILQSLAKFLLFVIYLPLYSRQRSVF
jgi:hypothetical protein